MRSRPRIALALAGVGLIAVGSLSMTSRAGTLEQRSEVALEQRDVVAVTARNLAAATERECAAAPGAVPAAVCEQARQVLSLPTVAASVLPEDPQLRALVLGIVASLPPGLDRAEVTQQVDEAIQEQTAASPDPVDEAQREEAATAAAALYAQQYAAPPTTTGTGPECLNTPRRCEGEPGPAGPQGPQGVSLVGLVFEGRDGRCVAVLTLADPATGETRELTAPVDERVCGGGAPPAPTETPATPNEDGSSGQAGP